MDMGVNRGIQQLWFKSYKMSDLLIVKQTNFVLRSITNIFSAKIPEIHLVLGTLAQYMYMHMYYYLLPKLVIYRRLLSICCKKFLPAV